MQKIKLWFEKTPKLITALYCLFSICSIIAAIILAAIGLTHNVITYILFGLSAVGLTYLVFFAIILAPRIKQGIIDLLKKHKFTNELLQSYGYRSLIFAICSFLINVAYAVMQGVIAILSLSIWYGVLAIYYISLSIIRGGIIGVSRKRQRKKQSFTLEKQVRAYRNCGIYLVLLTLALIAAIVQMAVANQGFAYAGLMIYTVATYTFYKLGLAIYNVFKVRKHNDYTLQSMKNLSLADSLLSLLALQTALLQAFGGGYNPALPNALTGAAISITIITMGIIMIIGGNKKLKELSEKAQQSKVLDETTKNKTEETNE